MDTKHILRMPDLDDLQFRIQNRILFINLCAVIQKPFEELKCTHKCIKLCTYINTRHIKLYVELLSSILMGIIDRLK